MESNDDKKKTHFYDKLIKRSMDIQKEYIPDSMPRSSLPQPNSDSIHAAVH